MIDTKRSRMLVRATIPFTVLMASKDVAAVETLFETSTGFVTGDYSNARFPYAIELGDVDGDGRADAVVAQWPWATGFALLPGRPDGSFGDARRIDSVLPALDLCLGDVDLDGDRDVVVSNTGYNYEGTTVSVFLNDGSGDFGPELQYSLAAGSRGPFGVIVDELTGDGLPDIAVTNYGWIGQGTTIDVLPGDGAGGFGPAIAHAVGEGPCTLVSGDVDGDGLTDLATALDAYPHMATLIFNEGGGEFSAPVTYTASIGVVGSYASVALADLENDGDLDLLFSDSGTRSGSTTDAGTIVIYRNQGDGTMGPMELLPLLPYTAGPRDLHLADVSGDGWVDVLAVHYSGRASDGWELVLNDGAGGFRDPVHHTAGQGTIGVRTADVDGDGDTDVVTTDNYSMEITVHENLGAGTFLKPPTYPTVPISLYLDTGDIDHDGDLDLLTTGGATYPVAAAILLNEGDGRFGPYQVMAPPYDSCFGKLRDLDGDGNLDILMAGGPPYPFYTALGNGDGTFGPMTMWPVPTCGAGDIDAFDLDGDGALDVCYLEYLGCPSGGNNRLFISFGRGDGTFGAPVVETIDVGPYQLVGADFDEDGNIDLATAHYGYYGSENAVDVLLGNGDGTFQPRRTHTVPNGPKDILAADLTGDGILDLATCNTGNGSAGIETMSVLRGLGGGEFSPPTTYYAAYSSDLLGVNAITAGDADADGDLDLMVSNSPANDVSYYENRGDGTFETQIRFGVGPSTWSATYADVTGDGIGDLVAVVGQGPSGLDGAVAVVAGTGTAPVAVDAGPTGPRLLVGKATPNPFRFRVEVPYLNPAAGAVRLRVFDPAGRLVFDRTDDDAGSGWNVAGWDGRSLQHERVAPGIYFLRLDAGGRSAREKALLVE